MRREVLTASLKIHILWVVAVLLTIRSFETSGTTHPTAQDFDLHRVLYTFFLIYRAIFLLCNLYNTLHTVSTQQHQYSDIIYAIGYTLATCFDRKRSSSSQERTFCLRHRKAVLNGIPFRLQWNIK